MRKMPIGRTLLSPATFRQQILGFRRWTILSLAALTALFTVPWMMFSERNEWPAKVTLRRRAELGRLRSRPTHGRLPPRMSTALPSGMWTTVASGRPGE